MLFKFFPSPTLSGCRTQNTHMSSGLCLLDELDEVLAASSTAPAPRAAPAAPAAAPPALPPPAAIERVAIVQAQTRLDSSGARFGSFTVRALLDGGGALETERRYSDFVALHSELATALALDDAFPVAASALPFSLLSARAELLRRHELQQYLRDVTARAAGSPAPAPLLAFLQPPPFTATATPAAECVAALPTAGSRTALAILRAHLSNGALQRAAAERIASLSEGGEATSAQAELVVAGAAEALTAALKRAAQPAGGLRATLSGPPTGHEAAAAACRALCALSCGAPARRAPASVSLGSLARTATGTSLRLPAMARRGARGARAVRRAAAPLRRDGARAVRSRPFRDHSATRP